MQPPDQSNMSEAPPEQGAPPAPDQGGDAGVKDLIVGIHNNLLKFKEVLMSAPQIPDEVKAGLDKVLEDYKAFVSGLAQNIQGGGAQAPQGQVPPPAAPVKGAVPVKKGPMPMTGGKGAVPAL